LRSKHRKEPDMNGIDQFRVIKQALENDKYSFRTVKGVAKEVRLKPDVVQDIISKHSDEVVILHRRGTNGELLYTTRNHYKKKATLREKIMGAVLNRVY